MFPYYRINAEHPAATRSAGIILNPWDVDKGVGCYHTNPFGVYQYSIEYSCGFSLTVTIL